MKISNADIYIDEHTVTYDYKSIYRNLISQIPEENQNTNFIFNYKDLILNNNENAINESVA